MPLSWTEIRDRAVQFQKRWKDETSERGASQPFWTEFFNIYGVDRKRVGTFEKKVALKRAKSVKNGRIDLFWPGKLLIEMKSGGQDLDHASCDAVEARGPTPAAWQHHVGGVVSTVGTGEEHRRANDSRKHTKRIFQ
jgi:hypothetical protein